MHSLLLKLLEIENDSNSCSRPM